MNKQARDVYQHAVNYLTEKNKPIKCNILEFVCRHYCSDVNLNKREIFLELRQYFNLTTTGVILQLISALRKGNIGETYPQYKVYLDALKYGEKQAKSDMVLV